MMTRRAKKPGQKHQEIPLFVLAQLDHPKTLSFLLVAMTACGPSVAQRHLLQVKDHFTEQERTAIQSEINNLPTEQQVGFVDQKIADREAEIASCAQLAGAIANAPNECAMLTNIQERSENQRCQEHLLRTHGVNGDLYARLDTLASNQKEICKTEGQEAARHDALAVAWKKLETARDVSAMELFLEANPDYRLFETASASLGATKRNSEKARLQKSLAELTVMEPPSLSALEREARVATSKFAGENELRETLLKAACILAGSNGASNEAIELGMSLLKGTLDTWPCATKESETILNNLLSDAMYTVDANDSEFSEAFAKEALHRIGTLITLADKAGARSTVKAGRAEVAAIEKSIKLWRQLDESVKAYSKLVEETEAVLIGKNIVTWFGDRRRFHVPAPSKTMINGIAKRFGALPHESQKQYLAHLRKLFFAADASGLRSYRASSEFQGETWAKNGAVELYWFQQIQRHYRGYDSHATKKAASIADKARRSCRGDYSTYSRMWASAAGDAYRELAGLMGDAADYTIVNAAIKIGEACVCTLSCAGVYFR